MPALEPRDRSIRGGTPEEVGGRSPHVSARASTGPGSDDIPAVDGTGFPEPQRAGCIVAPVGAMASAEPGKPRLLLAGLDDSPAGTASEPASLLPVRRGDILAGKYRIDGYLGRGGVAVVVAARHLQLDERVAIKFLLPEVLSSAEAVARFELEARTAVKIKSEHVAQVFDVGRLDDGAPYIVMEHLEGEDLEVWLERRGPLRFELAAELVLQACEAIAEAHALGIVHRDLKPGNLFCVKRADGLLSVKVLDFGISKVTGLDGLDLAMTRSKAIVGSPLYMSPEQMRSSHDVDARTDIWSLGVMLYELVTGRTPFSSEGLANLAVEITQGSVPSLRALRPDVPERFETVVLQCLEKSPDDRYLNVGELAEALAEFAPPRAASSVERVMRVVRTASLTSPSLLLPAHRPRGTRGTHSGISASWGRSGRRTNPGAGARIANATIIAVMLLGGGAVAASMTSSRVSDAVSGAGAPWRFPPPLATPLATTVPPPPTSVQPVVQLAPLVTEPTTSRSPVPAPAPPLPPRRPVAASPPRRAQWSPPVVPAAIAPPALSSPSPPPALAAHVKPDCDPPYDIDAAGHRQYKLECL
jgi:serine/threonine protein kinase